MKKPTSKTGGQQPSSENTKYAKPEENTKYAKPAENTKYAKPAENTKYAKPAEHTKYARGDARRGSMKDALVRRRAVDAAFEEALMSATAAVDRVHPGISVDARANLVSTMLQIGGGQLLEAHLDAIASGDGQD